MNKNNRREQIWVLISLAFLALTAAVILSIFFINKHNAFNTRTYDFGRFSQAIWNVLHGRFLFTTIDYRSILGNHFSPYMALLAPLLLIWSDERLLLIVQVLSVVASGLILASILYRSYPRLTPFFLLAFYLNPAVQTLTLFEFRRVVLVMPFLALALWALDRQKKKLLLAALLVALLGKEDIGLFVAGVGLYFLIAKRDVRWGIGLSALGLGWAIIVSLWVIPAFRAPGTEYPQLFYFDYLGGSYREIGATLLSDPFILIRQLLTLDRLTAVGRILLPLGIFLPFLAPEWLLIALPPLALLLLSGDAEIYGLLKWYPTTILPVLFAGTAVGISRFSPSRARLLTAWLLGAALLGYWLYGPLPGGREYDAELYTVTDHDRKALAMISLVPDSAAVATQPHFVPHLSFRENIYHYPWIKIGQEKIDFFLFDRLSDLYPFEKDAFTFELAKFLVNPDYALIAQTDDIFLFQQNDTNEDSFDLNQTIEKSVLLAGFGAAVQQDDGFYHKVQELPIRIEPGEKLQVTLFWEALQSPEAERTISVRLVDSAGNLVAQHDGLPGEGSRPMSLWQPGQKVRDMHYLEIPAGTAPQSTYLEILLYDTYTTERVPFSGGLEKINLAEVDILENRE